MDTPGTTTLRTEHLAQNRVFSSTTLDDHGTQKLVYENSVRNLVRTAPEPYPYARKTPEKVCGRNGGPIMSDSFFKKKLHILDSAQTMKSARDIDTFGFTLRNGHLTLSESGSSLGFQSGSLGG